MARFLQSALLWAAITVPFLATTARAQSPGIDVQAQMEDVLRYTGIEKPDRTEVAKMTELWTRAQDASLAREERRLALRDMYVLYSKLHGRDLTARPQTLDGFTQFVMTAVDGGARMNLTLPSPRGKPSGRYLSVETVGRGPTPLLLISDFGIDGGKLYASFARRQAAVYTMHIVTLPLAGQARPLPWPETLDFAARPWLTEIERELLALVDEPRMKGVTIVGTSGGGYLAERLALLRPKQIHRVVLAHALVASPIRSLSEPDAPAPLGERLERVRSVSPAPQLFPVAPVPPADELRRLIADPKSTHPTARNWWAFAVKDTALSRAWSFEALSAGFFQNGLEYTFELFSTDLTGAMKDLAVPTLAMGTWPDEGSPSQTSPSISQWEEVKLLYPSIPLTVVAFDDTRTYISEDAPEEFDRALADFLAGRPVRGKTGYSLPRTSPRASAMEAVGGGEIRIAYGRPAVKERKIWGALVPNGRVWRAGANEATTFATTRDVRIEGRPLSAGTYTFFVVPGETDWTLVFNRVPRQWGAFNYNPAFDALRVTRSPGEGPHQEALSYSIEPQGPTAARVELSWEKKRVEFRVETD